MRAPGKELSKRKTERLATRAETTGCDRCGTRFAELMPYFISRTGLKAFSVRCPDCAHRNAEPFLVASFYGGGDPWSASDRSWFASSPHRMWRLREPMPGELGLMAHTVAATERVTAFGASAASRGMKIGIAVKQVEPGKRVRSLVAIPTDDPLESYTDRGITLMVPALMDAVDQTVASVGSTAEAAHLAEMERRLRMTAAVMKVAS